MNLWIRSQDGEKIEKVSNVQYYYKPNPYGIDGVGGNHYIGTHFDNLCILGEYKTKKRALEILDEIQNLLETRDDVNQMVYEMPKE